MYLVFFMDTPPPTPEQYWDIKHNYPTIRVANSNYLHLQIYPYD